MVALHSNKLIHIVVVLLFCGTLILQVTLHSELPSARATASDSKKTQLNPASEPTVSLADLKSFPLDYYALEPSLWRFKSNPDGGLAIDGQTLKGLDSLSKLIPNDLPLNHSQHLSRLIERSVPGNKGAQLLHFLSQYQVYQADYQSRLQTISRLKAQAKFRELKNLDESLERLQREFFGAHADALFTHQNLTTHYYHQRLLVNLDSEVPKLQRQQQLLALQKAYLNAEASQPSSEPTDSLPKLP